MASSFDRKIIAKVRSETGATDEAAVPRSDIEDELESAKVLISEEVRERLNNGESLNFGEEAGKAALENYLFLRISEKARASGGEGTGPPGGPPDHVPVPMLPSMIRRTDFEDSQMNFWRDKLISAIQEV